MTLRDVLNPGKCENVSYKSEKTIFTELNGKSIFTTTHNAVASIGNVTDCVPEQSKGLNDHTHQGSYLNGGFGLKK